MSAVAGGDDPTFVFHEKQAAALCGRHAINNLLQGVYVNEIQLAEIAAELDERERALMMAAGTTPQALQWLGQDSTNVDDSGNFSISVLREALRRSKNVNLETAPELVRAALSDPNRHDAYLLNLQAHWFALRRLPTSSGPCWFNLNSLLPVPEIVSDFYLSAFLTQMKEDGYSIFVVTGALPPTSKDRYTTPATCWHTVGEVRTRQATAGPAARSVARQQAQKRAREMASDDPEYAAALAASLRESSETGSSRGYSAGMSEDDMLRMALEASMASESGGNAARAFKRRQAAPDEDADIKAAIAMSLSSAASAPASSSVSAPAPTPAPARAPLAPEPAEDAPCVRVMVRIPGVEPAEQKRRFAPDAPADALFGWVASCLPAASAHKTFQLVSGFPRVLLTTSSVAGKAVSEVLSGAAVALTLAFV